MKLFAALIISLFIFSCKSKKTSVVEEKDRSLESPGAFFSFAKADSANPILTPGISQMFFCPILRQPVRWEEKDVFNPAAVVRNDTLFLLYRAEDRVGRFAGTSRIGLAWSLDGIRFRKYPVPVLYPDNDAFKIYEWEGGIEDPRVVRDEKGVYYMTYTAYDGKVARMLVASSPDLYRWTKHGPVFANADGGAYVDKWSKSGSIISHYEFGTPVATRINGKYWMYGGDVNIWIASSDDLINWTPVKYAAGEQPPIPLRHNSTEIADWKIVFGPREKAFDSDLVEPGPPAIIADNGIWLIYNSRNVRDIGDTSLAEGTYAAGWVVLDKNDPSKVIERSSTYFMKPDKPYEMTGQVNYVCFLEGLVKYHGKWFLYYGTADSKIAVAVKE